MILDQTKPDEAREILRTACDLIMSGRTWSQVMGAFGLTESSAFKWLDQARAAERAHNTDSVWYLDYPTGTPPAFWHKQAFKARQRRSLILDAAAVHAGLKSLETEEVVIVDGKICWQENPELIGMDDAQAALWIGCEPEQVPWHRIARDKNGKPIPLMRSRTVSSALIVKLLEGLLPEVYGQKLQVDARTEQVVKVIGPSFERDANAPKALPAPLETDSELVRDLKTKLAAGVRYSYPQTTDGKRIPVAGLPAVVDPPDNPRLNHEPPSLADHPRAYVQPTPEQPKPDYSRPRPEQTRLADSAGFGHGKPLPGGMKVV